MGLHGLGPVTTSVVVLGLLILFVDVPMVFLIVVPRFVLVGPVVGDLLLHLVVVVVLVVLNGLLLVIILPVGILFVVVLLLVGVRAGQLVVGGEQLCYGG